MKTSTRICVILIVLCLGACAGWMYVKFNNALADIPVVDINSGAITWVDTDEELEYTAWVFWTPDSDQLFFQQLSRNQDHLKMFSADPAKFAPAYGGWCSAGASKGKKVPTMPDLWVIVDGQLYLNSSPKAHNDLFLANTEAVIRKGETNWKTIFATSRETLLAK